MHFKNTYRIGMLLFMFFFLAGITQTQADNSVYSFGKGSTLSQNALSDGATTNGTFSGKSIAGIYFGNSEQGAKRTSATLPFTESFDNATFPPADWKVVNNNDGTTWTRATSAPHSGAGNARYSYHGTLPGDDYLITPGITLAAGQTVNVSYWLKAQSASFAERMKVLVGTDTTLAGFTTVLNDHNNYTTTTWTKFVVPFTAPAAGDYYFAFYAYSAPDKFNLDLDDVEIAEPPVVPIITVNPATTAFGAAYIGGFTQKTITVANEGGAPLTATLTLPARVTASSTSLNVANGATTTVTLTFTPTDTLPLNDSIRFVTNDPQKPDFYYKVTGTSVQPFVMSEIIQNFDTSATPRPANWTGDYAINATGGVGGSKRLTRNLYSSVPTAYFQTPFFAATATSQLKFFYRVVDYTGYPATATAASSFKIMISVSTNFGGSFTPFDSIGAHNHTAVSDYVEKSYNLGSFAGKTIQVRIDGYRLGGDFYSDFDNFYLGTPPQVAIDWGNLQWPATATVQEGSAATVYGQAYKAGVTDSAGQAFGLNAWVGISPTNTNPATWSNWVPAPFNVQIGNNDEFMVDIGANLPAGTYYYAFRYQYLGGPYKYGGYNSGGGGFWDSTNNVSGVLTVTPYSITSFPYLEGFENAGFPPTGWKVEDKNGTPTWTRATGTAHSGTGKARYSYSSTKPGDDYLISPAVVLASGQTIKLSYWYNTGSYDESMKVLVGRAQTGDSLTTVLATHSPMNNTVWQNNSIFFTAPEAGSYYFGFYCYSAMDQYYLDLDDIEFSEPAAVDYAMYGFVQTAYPADQILAQKGIVTSKKLPFFELDPTAKSVASSNVNNSKTGYAVGSVTEAAGMAPIHMMATVKRNGSTGPAFSVGASFNGTAATTQNSTGIPTIGGTEDFNFIFNPVARGTFSGFAYVSAGGDADTGNDTLVNTKIRAYPDSAFALNYDQFEGKSVTFLGFGTNNLPFTGGVRATATQNMRLTNVDAAFRNEASTDSIVVRIWAAGAGNSAPGEVLYTKKFAGENYINPGEGAALVSFPLGDDAPYFLAGSDFWVSVSFVSTIQYPMASLTGALPELGRSFYSSTDGASWSAAIIGADEYAFVIRPIGVPYTPPPPPVFTTLWSNSAAGGTLPAWFSTSHTERGFAVGTVDDGSGNMVKRMIIVSRNGGNFMRVVDLATGADAGTLTMDPMITGGLLPINDAEITADGKILAANVCGNVAGSEWRVYMWNNLTAAPTLALSFNAPANNPMIRLGDKFRVTGNFYNNSAVIWAADANNPKVYKFTMSGGAFNPVPEVITLSNGAFGGSASVAPLPDGSFYYNATGKNPMKFQANGTIIDTIPGSIIATGSNSIQFLGSVNRALNEYVLTFAYGGGNENGFMAEVPDGNLKNATLYGKSPSLGSNANANGAGDVAMIFNDDNTITFYVLSTNNGFGAYKLTNIVPVELASFAATTDKNNVNLNWSTATETNSSEFVIERKATDGNWSSVGSVRAAGTSTSPLAYSFIDRNVETGKYSYRLRQIDLDGSATTFKAIEVEVGVPTVFDLSQNYPNPFNPSTKVNFSLPVASNITLDLYDISGQKVATILSGNFNAGYHSVDRCSETETCLRYLLLSSDCRSVQCH